jgi:hypothetical protein
MAFQSSFSSKDYKITKAGIILLSKTFLEDTVNFTDNVNKSLIERGQIIDSLDILVEQLEKCVMRMAQDERVDLIRAEGLLSVVLLALKVNQDKDTDLHGTFEVKHLMPEKRAVREQIERENEVSANATR